MVGRNVLSVSDDIWPTNDVIQQTNKRKNMTKLSGHKIPCKIPSMGISEESLTVVCMYAFETYKRGAQINGPIRKGIMLLTTNEIAGLVVFYGWSLIIILHHQT